MNFEMELNKDFHISMREYEKKRKGKLRHLPNIKNIQFRATTEQFLVLLDLYWLLIDIVRILNNECQGYGTIVIKFSSQSGNRKLELSAFNSFPLVTKYYYDKCYSGADIELYFEKNIVFNPTYL